MRGAGRLLLGGAVLVTSAGACQAGWEGPLPSPDEVGAAPLPTGSRTDGVTAVYATLTREEADGERCHRLILLAADGTAEATSVCSVEPVALTAADARTWERDDEVGDYGYAAGRLWIRTVSWDAVVEELVVSEVAGTYCGTQLRSQREPIGGGVVDVVHELVVGSAPPDAAPCP